MVATNQNAPPPVSPPKFNSMISIGETPLCAVHRTLVGLVILYIEAIAGVAAVAALLVIVLPDILKDTSSEKYRLVIGGSLLAVMLLVLVLLLATYIYRQNKIIITNKSVVQILQRGLFTRKVSRLSMSNVEDVTADQNGFLPSIFNYGTLTIETAGEQENFSFPYCPNPNHYCQFIHQAREAYAEKE